jgi:Fe-S-cluster-containing dehydrogenase component
MANRSTLRSTVRFAITNLKTNLFPMNHETKKTYWKSLAERDGTAPEALPHDPHGSDPQGMSRRRFLEAAGFTVSLTAVSGCGRAPTITALPAGVQPEDQIPGRNLHYASTCAGCPAGCGLLVSVRDGRPIKMEGMPKHPLSRGGLCAIGQALPLGLYDSHRLTHPLRDGARCDWQTVDGAVIEQLKTISQRGGAVRFVTASILSPTLKAEIDSFLGPFDDARHVICDPVSCSAILDAHRDTHGARLLPHFRFDRANVIVSFGADFLGTWISPVEFTAAWRSRRTPTPEHPQMSFHVQLEGRMSLTGSNADKRIRLAPDAYGAVLSQLAVRLSELAGEDPPRGTLADAPLSDADLDELTDRLWQARGESIVVSDSQEIAVQRLVNSINRSLGNYGKTVDIQRPSRQRQGNDAELLQLIDELKDEKVSALFVAGIDWSYNLPNRDSLAQGIQAVPLVVSFAEREDEFASLAGFVCPDHHPLESWLDAEPTAGVLSLTQPTLQPLGGTRSILESLARWSGRTETAHEIVRAYWENNVMPRAGQDDFSSFWDQSLHDGCIEVVERASDVPTYSGASVELVATPAPHGFTLALYSKVGLTDSRHAQNPWLQELPDPVTKVTWDNYVCVSPSLAEEKAITDGDLVRVESPDGDRLELPALVQPGQHDRVLAIALGYGVRGTDRFATVGPEWIQSRPTVAAGELVGKNAAGFIDIRDQTLRYVRPGVQLTKIGGRRDLASTQVYDSLEVPAHIAPHGAEIRHAVQETTLPAFLADPTAGKPAEHHFADEQLWPEDHPMTKHWGMVVDLNACTGCSACLIACQSENNVPVVGKDEVRRRRDMHWIRLDRYYSGNGDDVEVSHQPMMCQHCDNAPCETVCPVLATVHGEGGLNQQAYNRCVGTRYCANNCPYKVRRFNWFNYDRDDSLQNLALNPDVTVRRRGVMEKCSMCIQRIEEGKIEARRLGEDLIDGAIQTACQQSCPAGAIIFGDMNDADSRVHASLQDPRAYRVLDEFNFRPSVSYLRIVRNHSESDGVADSEAHSGADGHESNDHEGGGHA